MKKPLLTQPSLSRDFALLSAVIIFISLLVSVWVTYETYVDHSQKVVKQLETQAARVDRTLIIEFENASYLLESLARQIALRGSADKQFIAQLFKSFNPRANVNNFISWADETQMSVVSGAKGIHEKPVDVSDRDYIKKSLIEPWKAHIGRPVEGRVSGKWIIPLGMGLTDDNGKFLGTAVISLSVSNLTDKMNQILDNEGISFAVYSTSFGKISGLSNDERFIEQHFTPEMVARIAAAKTPSGVVSKASLFDRSKIHGFYEISSKHPYVILLGMNNAYTKSAVFALLWPRLLQLAVMAGFLVSLLWLIRVRIIRPVIDLTEISAKIARGEQYIPGNHDGPLEIELLALQLKKVSDYIVERERVEDELLGKVGALRKAKEMAELTNRIKVEFLASMGQELRTPLNTIVGFSEIMKNKIYGPIENPIYVQYCDDIHRSAAQLLEVINDVLALSKVESGLLELKETPLKVAAVVNRCLRLVSEKIQFKQLDVRLVVPDNLPKLLIDELRLKQLILNLLTNTVRMTPVGGEIVIEVRLEADKKNQNMLALLFTGGGESLLAGEMGESAPSSQVELGDIGGLALPLSRTLAAMNQVAIEMTSLSQRRMLVALRFPKERLVFWE